MHTSIIYTTKSLLNQVLTYCGSRRIPRDSRVVHQNHSLVDHGGTLVEVLAMQDLVLQTVTEHTQEIPHLAVVRTDLHIKVLKL